MKIGSRVKLIGSWKDDKYNPTELEGTIVSMDGKYNPIIVKWSNGIQNSYIFKNLDLV